MKKGFFYFLLCLLFFSCSKEHSFEQGQVSAGFLSSDGAGNCGPTTVSGVFTAREVIPSNAFAEVTVVVKAAGGYSIQTDTVNGYSFSTSGYFSDTGTTTVRLSPHGTPAKAGVDQFAVFYDSSICQLEVTVNANSSDPAAFTLYGAPGKCMDAVVSGSFIKSVALDTSSKVKVGVMVTTPGVYSIQTNTLNGYSFSGSGSLLNTGLQFVTLTATGTPSSEGINSFTVTTGTSSCSFTDTVLIPVAPANLDYFPLTDNSFWVYNNTSYPGDSIVRSIVGASTTNGQQYKIMDELIPFIGHRQLLFRKNVYDYIEYASGDEYTATLTYSPSIFKDMIFVKDNLATGDAWSSDEFKGPASFGQVILIRYDFNCTAANSAATINGKAFINVHKVVMRPQIKSESGSWNGTGEIYNFYYAKGIGLIYASRARNGYVEYDMFLRRWKVN